MDKKSNTYTFIFAFVVCVVCSLSVAAVSQGLKARQETNVKLDIKKNILKAVGLNKQLSPKASPDEILGLYHEKIEELVIDRDGTVIKGVPVESIDLERDEGIYPLYVYKEGPKVEAYCFPIVGKGLWSTLYGYFALEADGQTVRGITFYKQGETPGLGAEIEKDWFQNNFRGKSVWSDKQNKLWPIAVAQGKVSDRYNKEEAVHYVDGISGATMTSKGVTALLDKWIRIYDPFFSKIREKGRGKL